MYLDKQDILMCCTDLDWDINSRYSPVHYSKKWREYSICDLESTSITLMTFCYHCGAKFPSSLRNKWFDFLESEYNIEATLSTPLNEIPTEFHTDDWWKKRGL